MLFQNSHHLAEGQAALGKPHSADIGRQQMGFTITLKPGTEVIDITKNPGYSIIVHKKPLPFPV
jgi:hypothetical protein